MRTQDFEALRDHIMKYNKYFSTGYANAYKDTETSAIWCRVEDGLKSIFPDDRVGNYFYLRNDPSISFMPQTGLTDYGPTSATFDDRQTVYLVAVVSDANEYELIANLRNSCLMYKPLNVVPVGAMWQRENVVLHEMAGFDDDEKMAALEALTNETIVRIELRVSKEFIPSLCINDLCKDCQ